MILRLIAIAILLIAGAGSAIGGQVLPDQRAPSRALGGEIAYTVYLPDAIAEPSRRFPVVYLLHGYGAGQGEWFKGGRVAEALDRLIGAGEIVPVIAVAPSAGKSWYVDSAAWGGPGDYETAIVRDLVEAVDRAYPTRTDRTHRAIAGNSMGGRGALRLAFAHLDTFGAVAALSPAIWKPGSVSSITNTQLQPSAGREKWFPRTTGETFDRKVFNAQSPFALVAAMAASGMPPRIFLASGDDDYWHLEDGTLEMYLDIVAHGLRPELRVGNGGHDWKFWRRMVEPALRFFDAGWHERK